MIAKEWIEIARAIGAHEDPPGEKILQGKAERVKFNGTIIITNKFASATKVLNDRRRDENIIENKGSRS